MIALVVPWRLRYKLRLRDLAEMFLIRGIMFTYETVRDWEAKLTPALADELRRRRKGKVGRSWYVDGASRTRACEGVWNCTRDEGGPLGAGSQVQASNHCKLLSSKAMVVSVAAKGGTTSHQVWSGEASASEPLMTCRNTMDDDKTGGASSLRDELGGSPGGCLSGIRHIGGAKPD